MNEGSRRGVNEHHANRSATQELTARRASPGGKLGRFRHPSSAALQARIQARRRSHDHRRCAAADVAARRLRCWRLGVAPTPALGRRVASRPRAGREPRRPLLPPRPLRRGAIQQQGRLAHAHARMTHVAFRFQTLLRRLRRWTCAATRARSGSRTNETPSGWWTSLKARARCIDENPAHRPTDEAFVV